MKRIKSLDIVKPILLIGVVLIHSLSIKDIPNDSNTASAIWIINLFSFNLGQSCVPAFFIISGYLFYYSEKSFSYKTYIAKLKRRCKTLLIPYLLWNGIGSIVFLIKSLVFNYSSYGIIMADKVNFIKYLEGFIMVYNTNPYDAPMWFIRNLIIIVFFSPVIYTLARNTWIAISAILIGYYSAFPFFGWPYFLIGAWLALHFTRISNRVIAVISLLILTAFCISIWRDIMNECIYKMCIFTRDLGLTALTILIGRQITQRKLCDLSSLQGMNFFIYAIHGLYCGLLSATILRLIGDYNSIHILCAYILSFILLVAISSGIYIILHKISPRLTSLLTGNR